MKNETEGQTFIIERAAEIVGDAFRPLECIAQTVNFGSRIEFEVSDNGKRVLKNSIPSDLAHKDYNLRTQIIAARRVIEEQGRRLDPWEMPSS